MLGNGFVPRRSLVTIHTLILCQDSYVSNFKSFDNECIDLLCETTNLTSAQK